MVKIRKKQLGNTIYRLGHLEHQIIDRRLAPYGLKLNHVRVLSYLLSNPGSLQKDVANYMDYQPASLTNLLKLLEKRNMIIKKADPKNGRQKNLYLTKQGEKILEITYPIIDEFNALVSDLDPEINRKLEGKYLLLKEKFSKKEI